MAKYTKDELAEWFKDKASSASSIQARNALFNADDRKRDDTLFGRLYVFKYDAKNGPKLPMWDKYPLCMILERRKDGFLGLNLHYLPGGSRMGLLEGFDKYLHDYSPQTGVTTGRGVSNWELLIRSFNSSGNAALPQRCLKRYLFTHIRSRFIEIYPEEYDKAIQLPIDLWTFKEV